MRSLVGFLGPRLFRALIAMWLVSTVVFVVMRLSGDPVPLLVPADAPRSEYERPAYGVKGTTAIPGVPRPKIACTMFPSATRVT